MNEFIIATILILALICNNFLQKRNLQEMELETENNLENWFLAHYEKSSLNDSAITNLNHILANQIEIMTKLCEMQGKSLEHLTKIYELLLEQKTSVSHAEVFKIN